MIRYALCAALAMTMAASLFGSTIALAQGGNPGSMGSQPGGLPVGSQPITVRKGPSQSGFDQNGDFVDKEIFTARTYRMEVRGDGCVYLVYVEKTFERIVTWQVAGGRKVAIKSVRVLDLYESILGERRLDCASADGSGGALPQPGVMPLGLKPITLVRTQPTQSGFDQNGDFFDKDVFTTRMYRTEIGADGCIHVLYMEVMFERVVTWKVAGGRKVAVKSVRVQVLRKSILEDQRVNCPPVSMANCGGEGTGGGPRQPEGTLPQER